jgi:hypothetical protein
MASIEVVAYLYSGWLTGRRGYVGGVFDRFVGLLAAGEVDGTPIPLLRKKVHAAWTRQTQSTLACTVCCICCGVHD